MKKWTAIRSDAGEDVRKRIQLNYKGKFVMRGKGTELWEVDVDYEENLSLKLINGSPLEAKFEIGDSAYLLRQEVTDKSLNFRQVNGNWEILYTVMDSQEKTFEFYENQLSDKP